MRCWHFKCNWIFRFCALLLVIKFCIFPIFKKPYPISLVALRLHKGLVRVVIGNKKTLKNRLTLKKEVIQPLKSILPSQNNFINPNPPCLFPFSWQFFIFFTCPSTLLWLFCHLAAKGYLNNPINLAAYFGDVRGIRARNWNAVMRLLIRHHRSGPI